MTSPKFEIGQLVEFDSKLAMTTRTSGPYEVVRVLPSDAAPQQTYRVRSKIEPFERVAMEYELVAVEDPELESGSKGSSLSVPLKTLAIAVPRRRAASPGASERKRTL